MYIKSTDAFKLGERASLVCHIEKPQILSEDFEVEWIGPNGKIVNSTTFVSLNSSVISKNVTEFSLQFSSLFTSHGGEYTCQVTLKSENMYTIAATRNVFILGILHSIIEY